MGLRRLSASLRGERFASRVAFQDFAHLQKRTASDAAAVGAAEEGPHAPVVDKGLLSLPKSVRLGPQDRHLYTYLEWRQCSFAKVSAAIRAGGPATVRGTLQSC
jgi:hypothetical protein